MIEDRRQRLRSGITGYGAEPPPPEDAAIPHARYDDRPWPTAGHAPPATSSSPWPEADPVRPADDNARRHVFPPGGPVYGYRPPEPAGRGAVHLSYGAGAVYSGHGHTDGGPGQDSADYDGGSEPGVYGGAGSVGYSGADHGGYGHGPAAIYGHEPEESGFFGSGGGYDREESGSAGSSGFPDRSGGFPDRSGGFPDRSGGFSDREESGFFGSPEPEVQVNAGDDRYLQAGSGDVRSGVYGGWESGGAESRGFGATGAGAYSPADDGPASPTELYAALSDLNHAPMAPASPRPVGVSPGALIDLSAPRPLPVTHRGERRRLAVVLIAVGIGVAIAGSAGYAVLRPGPSGHPSAGGAATAPVTPAEEPATEPGELPVSIAVPALTSPAVSTTNAARPSATATSTGDGGAAAQPAATKSPTKAPTPTASASRPVVVVPTPSSTSTAPLRPLTAAYSQESDDGGGGSTGFVGTVRVSNPRDTEVTDWTVRFTVPGGREVTVFSGDVSVAQDGEAVTFHPNGALAAEDSMTFTFGVAGRLPALPYGCTVDGTACS